MDPKTDKQIIEEQAAEIAALKKQLADAHSGLSGIPEELHALVKEKRAAGLDFKTAVEAARNQLAWDKEQEKAEKKAKKKTD